MKHVHLIIDKKYVGDLCLLEQEMEAEFKYGLQEKEYREGWGKLEGL